MWKVDFSKLAYKIQPLAQKYKYALIILLVGLLMLCLGSPRDAPESKPPEKDNQISTFDLNEFEVSLEKQLSSIDGAGQVSLLLSVEDTEETVYASNTRKSTSGEANNTYENDLSVISDGSYGEQPIKIKSISPTFRGAVVLCEGADDNNVKFSITEAVSAVCGLSMDKISVLKMNSYSKEED